MTLRGFVYLTIGILLMVNSLRTPGIQIVQSIAAGLLLWDGFNND